MKTHSLLTILLLVVLKTALAQTPSFAWAKMSNSLPNPNVNSGIGCVVVDTINYAVYATGSLQGGGINFGSGDQTTSAQVQNAFLVKYDLLGNLVWGKAFFANYDTYATGVGVDNSGNVYVAGYSESDTVRFGSQFILNSNSNSSDHPVAFLAKFDASGNAQWVKGSSGGGGVICNALAVDATGNAYLTGYVLDNTGLFFGSSMASESAFFAKISSSGTLTWLKQTTPSSPLISQGVSVTLDHSGNCLVTGTYANNISCGSIALSYSGGNGTWDRFTTKLDASGNFVWAVGSGIWQGPDYNYDVTTDAQNNVYVSGNLCVATQGSNTSSYVQKQFVEKLDASGTLQWQHTYDKSSLASPVSAIACDKTGHAYTVFNISSATVYGNYTVTLVSPTFSNSTLVTAIVKFDNAGNVLYTKANTDPVILSWAVASSAALDGAGNLYVGGSIYNECKFDNIDLTPQNSHTEFLISKLASGNGTGVGIREQSAISAVSCYPNPANTSICIKGLAAETTITITDLNGRMIRQVKTSEQASIDVSTLLGGMYVLEAEMNGVRSYQKILITHD